MTMRVIAFMPVYNEADILAPSVLRLAASGVSTYILDNWSTDGSWEIARTLPAECIAGLERFPHEGAADTYNLVMMRARVAELAARADAEWFVWNDADEYLHPAEPNRSVPEVLREVAAAGFNAVEQVVAVFPPVDDRYAAGTDFVKYFRHWRPQPQTGTRPWVRVWRNTGATLTFHGGNHEIDFVGRRVAPVPFVLRHYPLRSQQHAVRKIFVDRQPRFLSSEHERGWHTHYDSSTSVQSFLEDPADLRELDDRTLAEQLFAIVGRDHRIP